VPTQGRAPGAQGEGGAAVRRGPLTHSFKQRATASLLGSGAPQTNPAGGGGRLAPERLANEAGGDQGGGRGGRQGGARRLPRGRALSVPPRRSPAWGAAPAPPGPVPVGDPPRDSVMRNGYDLQRVSVNARVPATVRVCARPCPWLRGRVGVWAYVGVLGRVPSDM
jgi:hypothetical protein